MLERGKLPAFAVAATAASLGLAACGGKGVSSINLLNCNKGPKHNSLKLEALRKNGSFNLEGNDLTVQSLGKGSFKLFVLSSLHPATLPEGGTVVLDNSTDTGDDNTAAIITPNHGRGKDAAVSSVSFDENSHTYTISGTPGPAESTTIDVVANCN